MMHPIDGMIQSNVPLYRILDANLDRAREGLRVVEEWCRFGLDDATLALQCKHLRQDLGRWHHADFRRARDTPGDVGTALTHEQEQCRTDIPAVLQANFCRVQEALRVLEEYGKIYDPALGADAKQMRYQVYGLEHQLLCPPDRLQRLRRSCVYLVTLPVDGLLDTVEAALKGGVSLVQYRDKDADDIVRWDRAQALRSLCRTYNALFIVNDRIDLALATDADGVHLGQEDLPVAVARSLLGPQRLIGRSTTNPEELARAMSEGIDYIGVGPVYATPTKTNKAVAGLEYVRYAAEHSRLPWFAIGGIDADNIDAVMAAGANQVAVVRAIMKAEDPTQAAQHLISKMQARIDRKRG
ncbi:MAG: thiamine phosphate synthase [Thermosynechococcaceae cyanobacterium]